MNLICDFSVSTIGNEIEDLNMYDDTNTYTEDQMSGLIDRLVSEKKLKVGERCEGDISIGGDNIVIEYRYCSEVGEDWGSDEWEEDQLLELNRVEYGL